MIESELIAKGWSNLTAIDYVFSYFETNINNVVNKKYSETNSELFV